MTETCRKQKVAIIGGGVASLTAAYELTNPALGDRYEVTVYQQGWRLGGKGASGRNRDAHDRIEEHGLHIWMGFYENAFRIMRECYAALRRPPHAPLATLDKAFEPHSYIVWMEEVAPDRWKPWAVNFPTNDSRPGEGDELPTPWDYVSMLVKWMLELFERTDHGKAAALAMKGGGSILQRGAEIGAAAAVSLIDAVTPDALVPPSKLEWLRSRLGAAASALIHSLENAVRQTKIAVEATFLHVAHDLVMAAREGVAALTGGADALSSLLREFMDWFSNHLRDRLRTDDEARRLFILLDLASANVLGMLGEGLVEPGADFSKIDDYDYKAWIKKWGAADITIESAPVRALYDLVFSLQSGIAAGATLVCAMRMLLTYKGAIFWKMQAGMGDTVFTPLYEVLRARGVRFKFFHRVVELLPSEDGRSVAAIEVARQVNLKGDEYYPLYDVGGLPCWPSTPLYEQIVEGEELKKGGYDLESFWTDWNDVEHLRLEAGRDFDLVVLGASIGALPHLCPKLLALSEPLRLAVEHTKTTRTQAAQLWLKPDLAHLGWSQPSPVMTSYAEPFDTWADMTHLLPRESWSTAQGPGNLAYFCGYMPDDIHPPAPDPAYPNHEHEQAYQNARNWFARYTGALWPRATLAGTPGLDESLLVAPEGSTGEARFRAQYFRANINPTDRYVQTVPGSTKYRLFTDQSGFDNLYLTGDWIRTALNGGCVEAAVMAGLQTSHAICGLPEKIVGDPEGSRRPVRAQSDPTRDAAPRAPASLPLYIERGGDIVLRGPYLQQDTMLYSFVLPANYGALQRVCDKYLNGPTGEKRFVPFAPFVSLVCADIKLLRSLDPRDANKGRSREKDIAFWVPVVKGREKNARFEPERLVWYLAYIWVDNAPAMATGREVFGFPKESGTLAIPGSPSDPALWYADVMAIEHYAPDSVAQTRRVLEVRAAQPNDLLGELERDWVSIDALVSALRDAARSLFFGEEAELSWKFLASFVDDLFHGRMPMVFLQQFRDVQHPERAAYQALVEAPATVTGFRGAGPMRGEYQVQIANFDSHPIVNELGLPSGSLRPLLSVWVDFDFSMDLGHVDWCAGRR